jgi:hypothetical protein
MDDRYAGNLKVVDRYMYGLLGIEAFPRLVDAHGISNSRQ